MSFRLIQPQDTLGGMGRVAVFTSSRVYPLLAVAKEGRGQPLRGYAVAVAVIPVGGEPRVAAAPVPPLVKVRGRLLPSSAACSYVSVAGWDEALYLSLVASTPWFSRAVLRLGAGRAFAAIPRYRPDRHRVITVAAAAVRAAVWRADSRLRRGGAAAYVRFVDNLLRIYVAENPLLALRLRRLEGLAAARLAGGRRPVATV